ncbi:glycosyltransferase [Leucobacter sp. gxy201]|uniref:glycosyltransferase family 2 protein n=1 Tax=Leucobacter sp. gxy201 TaxID=2957200 RepID=UPI003D9FBF1B
MNISHNPDSPAPGSVGNVGSRVKNRALRLAGIQRLAENQESAAQQRAAEILDAAVANRQEMRQEVNALGAQMTAMLAEIRVRWQQEDELLQFLSRRVRVEIESDRLERARPNEMIELLQGMRESSDYNAAWEEELPLVSVRIASYRDTEALVNRAIPSVQAQSHTNWELIIVNDGPNTETRAAVEAIGDSRIRYEEFPTRSRYPEDPHLRWMVAGSPGMNRGAELARGSWIAPLDDDDEFDSDHIERLLDVARSSRAEFAYGAIRQKRLLTGDEARIYSDPPVAGQISMQAAIYHSGLRFMEYDTESWRVDEPGDWNLIRRMKDIGVRMSSTEDYVTTVHMLPYHAKDAAGE